MAPPDRSWADERLRSAHNYWLATTRPSGRPHLVPIWGVWLDERFWFTSYRGVKISNIAVQPSVVVTTETPGEVVILTGTAAEVDEEALPMGYETTFDAKYGPGWSGVGDDASVQVRVTPSEVRAWLEAEATDPHARFGY
ncbi:MAG: pyridoxamine 5'-phosphate oxidase family protein [Gaiellales bacterium]